MSEQNVSNRKLIGGWSAAGGVLATIIYALVHGGAPKSPAPSASLHVFDVVLCADGPDEQHAEAFTCNQRVTGRVSAETATDVWKMQDTDASGYVTFAAPPVPPHTRLLLEAAGYTTRTIEDFQFARCAEGCHNVFTLASLTPPPPVHPNAGESGPLHVVGLSVRDDREREWRYRGFTDFEHFWRYLHSEDLTPILTERVEVGANTLRVLLSAAALFDLRATDYSDAVLDAYLDTVAQWGLRVEAVLIADANPIPRFNLRGTFPTLDLQRAFAQRIGAVLARHWNAIQEDCNECSHEINHVDRAIFSRPPRPTLWERGSGQADEAPFTPVGDVVGDHPGRGDEWPRRLNCRDIRSNDGAPWGIHAPCWENEPMGAAESPDPGRRATNSDDFAQFAALAALNSNGALFHSDAGILSKPLGPVQKVAAIAFFDALKWVPLNAPLWPYRRGGLSGSQASCTKHDDTTQLRTFSKDNGTECWTVAIRTTVDPIGVDGWHVAETHRKGLVRLER